MYIYITVKQEFTKLRETTVDINKAKNYTSIDPKQLQNDSLRPILVKNRFLGTPYLHPKSKLLHQ